MCDVGAAAQPHALYRFFDRQGALLYIGLTMNPSRRFAQHAGDKPWWSQVARITLEPYASREEVVRAERDAIRLERPRHNVQHADGWIRPASVDGGREAANGLPLEADDVVAIGLPHDECRIGLVKSVGQWGVKLALYSAFDGEFGRSHLAVPWRDVLRIAFAHALSDDEMHADCYQRFDDRPFFGMDPLLEFDAWWTAGCGPAGARALLAARNSHRAQRCARRERMTRGKPIFRRPNRTA